MDVTLVIPWRWSDDRMPALSWLVRRLVERHADPSGWAMTIATCGDDEPWSKPRAILDGAAHATGDVLIFHDADVWTDGLAAAVAAVREGAAWAVPHLHVRRLGFASTANVLRGEDPHVGMGVEKRAYRGTAAGGVVVMRREVFDVAPPDPRFTGWGGEDAAWRDALRCLVGMEWRETREPLYHLHHRPAPRERRHHGSEENRALVARYAAARHDPGAMRALIDEPLAVAA